MEPEVVTLLKFAATICIVLFVGDAFREVEKNKANTTAFARTNIALVLSIATSFVVWAIWL